MNKKYIGQSIIIILELVLVCGLLTFLSELLYPIENINDGIQRSIAFLAIYEIIVYIFNKNQYDVKKDILLTYMNLLKETLLYIECPKNEYKNNIISKVEKLNIKKDFIDENTYATMNIIKEAIKNNQIVSVQTELKFELINAEHN
jgi:hypothetical protein